MNRGIIRGEIFVLCLSALLALSAHAASFDCEKAQTKVEHLICDNEELSRLDDELATSYKAALQDASKVDEVKLAQKQWMKERNNCTDAGCVRQVYRRRIEQLHSLIYAEQQKTTSLDPLNIETYTLLMSKDDELCNHMLQLFNDDLKKYGWKGDIHHEEHEEFKRVPWEPARFSSVIDGRTEYKYVEGALFDFNNDGVKDFVVRWKASLSGYRADLLIMFDSEIEKRKNDLSSNEFWNAKNHIDLSGWWYSLPPPFDSVAGVRVLEPFIYRNISYLVMRPLFETPPIISGYAAITKYGGGKFINRELTGKMEDVCYYRRNRAKHAQ